MKYEIEVCTKERDSTTISVERRGDKLVILKNLDEVLEQLTLVILFDMLNN